MSRTRQRIEALLTHVRTELTSHLLLEYGVRLRPGSLEWFKALLLKALNAAKLIGQLHAARPDVNEPAEADDELADTRPMKTKPPPPKH